MLINVTATSLGYADISGVCQDIPVILKMKRSLITIGNPKLGEIALHQFVMPVHPFLSCPWESPMLWLNPGVFIILPKFQVPLALRLSKGVPVKTINKGGAPTNQGGFGWRRGLGPYNYCPVIYLRSVIQ